MNYNENQQQQISHPYTLNMANGTPQQPMYGTPQQPVYGTPQQQMYGTPQQPPYGAPQQQMCGMNNSKPLSLAKVTNVFMNLHAYVFLGFIQVLQSLLFVFGIFYLIYSPVFGFQNLSGVIPTTPFSILNLFADESYDPDIDCRGTIFDKIFFIICRLGSIEKWLPKSVSNWINDVKPVASKATYDDGSTAPPASQSNGPSFLQKVFGKYKFSEFFHSAVGATEMIIASMILYLVLRLWGRVFYTK